MKGNDEFYIGWESKAPAGLGARMRRVVLVLFLICGGLALGLAISQRTIGVSVFEWGNVKDFSGVIKSSPYPHLLVPRPGVARGEAAFSSSYLVKPFKFALDPEIVSRFDGKAVSLRGTLIYRDNQTMIEVIPESVKANEHLDQNFAGIAVGNSMSLGKQTLNGEIVDSKCYFGVMNPGEFIPHRACAIRCISGGCPPVFVVQQTNGPPLCLLLVSADGHALNKEVLDMVAEPLQITGDVIKQDNLLILRADPASYRRFSP
jgi:hypothetical protein